MDRKTENKVKDCFDESICFKINKHPHEITYKGIPYCADCFDKVTDLDIEKQIEEGRVRRFGSYVGFIEETDSV